MGADIHFDFPSAGATENLMLAGVLAKGDTIPAKCRKRARNC